MKREPEIPWNQVPFGWTREHWLQHLRRIAEQCALAGNTEKAREFRERADAVEADSYEP